MSVIKNIIETLFTSSGASKVVKDTETINRSQTRLGQSSAGNARQFAAQANGLGGLVGAYAGAAATVFALEAAFTALSRAAQSDTILQGTRTLATEIGQSGPKILKSVQAITQGQLTLTEAAQNVNIALSAGFNTQQIEGFTEVALKASRALGRDLTDSFQRVVRGVAKLEPELLDEIGIFTRIEPAVQRYARQLGVSAKSLNEFQRRQAFANATIEEGLRKFGNIDTTSGSTQKTLEQLRVKVSELATEFTKLLVSVLEPLINFFTDDIGNALLLFGGIVTLVFAKGLSIISDWSRTSITNVSNFASNLASKAAEAKGSFDIIRNSVVSLNKEIADRGGLSQQEGRFNQTGVSRNVATEAAKARQRFIKGEQLNPGQIKADIDVLTQAQNQLAASGKQSSAAYTDATKIITTYSSAMQTAGLRTKALTVLSNTLAGAAKLAAGAFTFFAGALNFVFFALGAIQLVGTLFDVDVLAEIKGLFTDISKAAENLKNGFAGLVVASAGGSADLVEQLKLVGATEADLEALPSTIANIRNEIDAGATDKLQRSLSSALSPTGALLDARTKVTVTEADRLAEIEKRIADTRQSIADPGAFTSTRRIEELKQEVKILESLKTSITQFGTGYGKIVGELADITGIAAEDIAQNLKNNFVDVVMQGQNSLKVLGVEVSKIEGQLTLEGLSTDQKALVESGILAVNAVQDVTDSLKTGNVNTDKLGASIGGLQTEIDKSVLIYNKQTEAINLGAVSSQYAIDANNELGESIAALQNKVNVFIEIQTELQTIEKIYKSLTKVFGSEISLFENIESTGIANSLGVIASSQKEIDNNQAAYLAKQIEATKYSAILNANEEALTTFLQANISSEDERLRIQAKIGAEAELYSKSIDAVNGKIVSIIQAAKQLSDQFKTATSDIRAEINSINSERAVFKIEAEIDTNKIRRDLALAQEQAKLERLQLQVELVAAKEASNVLQPVEAAEQTNALEQQILDQRRSLIDLEYANNIAAINEENRILLAKFELSKQEILAQAQLQKSKIQADAANIQNLISLYSGFIADQSAVAQVMATSFVTAGNSVAQALATTLSNAASAIATAITTGDAAGVTAGVAATVEAGTITSQLGSVGIELQTATNELLNSIDERTTAEIEAVKERTNASILANAERVNAENNAHGNKLAALALEREIETENAKERIQSANEAGDAAKEATNVLKEKLLSLYDSIKGNFESTIMDLNNLIFYGEGSFNEILSGFFKQMQQDFFKNTIAEPLSDFLTESVFSAFGLPGGRKGIENAKVLPNGALMVAIVDAPAALLGRGGPNADSSTVAAQSSGLFGGFFDQITSLFSNIFGQNGFISKLFSGLFGGGGTMSGLFSGIGSIFSGIFGGIFRAQGGIVHLAQGGAAASASLMRDRVPAMLEPGEFVIRKQSAQKIGMPALQSMNATGSAGGAGNVYVNVTNEGTGKTVEQSQPRFDGEKYIVDIVMRDIANNGPIRRSLRGRGGL